MDYPAAETRPRFASKADFLAWEEEQETRFEFDGEEVAEVTGGTVNHVLIITNITVLLHQLLRGTAFMVLPQVKVETVPGYRYPDVSVGLRDVDGTKTIFPEPVVVFEVLSPTTAHVDLGRKRQEYAELLSVRRYVLVESRRMGAKMLARAADATWVETPVDVAGVVDLPEIGVTLKLANLYEDVRFG